MSTDETPVYEWGKAARMRALREYVGADALSMATLLRVALRSYQRWEAGDAAIPAGVWEAVDRICVRFDEQVEKLLDRTGPIECSRNERINGWPPSMWLRCVGEAMQENPGLEPFYPGDPLGEDYQPKH